jgi:hypothetical protein
LPTDHNVNPGYWRNRAATMRALIPCMENIETKATLTKLAEGYDKLAHQVVVRSRDKPRKPSRAAARKYPLGGPFG